MQLSTPLVAGGRRRASAKGARAAAAAVAAAATAVALLVPMSALGSKLELADRVAGALWGMLIADALAMPVHWGACLGL